MSLAEAVAVRWRRANHPARERGRSQGAGGIRGRAVAPTDQCHHRAQFVTGTCWRRGFSSLRLPPKDARQRSRRGRLGAGLGCCRWDRGTLGRKAERIDRGEQLPAPGVRLPWPPADCVYSCSVSLSSCFILSSICLIRHSCCILRCSSSGSRRQLGVAIKWRAVGHNSAKSNRQRGSNVVDVPLLERPAGIPHPAAGRGGEPACFPSRSAGLPALALACDGGAVVPLPN